MAQVQSTNIIPLAFENKLVRAVHRRDQPWFANARSVFPSETRVARF